MRIGIYSAYDKAAESFMRPFFTGRDAEAIRAFHDAINSVDGPDAFTKHYADLSLSRIGWFDDQTGELEYEFEHLTTGLVQKKDATRSL